jgi:Uma2 family endonuclease
VTTETESLQTETLEAPKVKSQKGTPTWEIACLYPKQGAWTEADYLSLQTNHPIELSEGCLEFLPMPTFYHQDLVAFVYQQLWAFVVKHNLGRVNFAPLRVRTGKGTYREPDVVFVKPERVKSVHSAPDGADLVVEVVSPGEESRDRDLEIKRKEYALCGISEYWIVDPEKGTVTVLALDGETYRVHGAFTKGQSADSVLLKGFALDVTALFSVGQQGEKTP